MRVEERVMEEMNKSVGEEIEERGDEKYKE
jgi:hypothetical protein